MEVINKEMLCMEGELCAWQGEEWSDRVQAEMNVGNTEWRVMELGKVLQQEDSKGQISEVTIPDIGMELLANIWTGFENGKLSLVTIKWL